MKQLRNYLKTEKFNDFKDKVRSDTKFQKSENEKLMAEINHSGNLCMEYTRKMVRDLDKRIETKMELKLENVPGYNTPSIMQTLGMGKYRNTDTDI